MNNGSQPSHGIDPFNGLSQYALTASIQYLNNQILYGSIPIWEAATYAYKVYRKSCLLEEFVTGKKIKGVSRLAFQKMVDPVAQSIWAYGDRDHAHLFIKNDSKTV
jgi:hypothetical protein